MRLKLINFLKRNNLLLRIFWAVTRWTFVFLHVIIPINKKKIAFTSFAGRNFDDSPKAIYDYMCNSPAFDDFDFVWFFINPSEFEIPRGEKVRIDSIKYVFEMLNSHIWISNSGMDRGLELHFKDIINVNTWHGTPLKRMGEDIYTKESRNFERSKIYWDHLSVKCAQSEYDKKIFSRVFHTDPNCFLMCDLPRNDALMKYSEKDCNAIKDKLGIYRNKKVILYTPTYREYAWDASGENYIAPPISIDKWKELLSDKYVLLFRAHYAVTAALNIVEDDFIKNVTDYPVLNDLYAIADIMISDYSSTFFDYAILDRPIFCFAYDYDEYITRRGLYLNAEKELPCTIHKTEDDLLNDILEMDYAGCADRTKKFHYKYAPNAGHATEAVVNEIKNRLDI